MIRAISIIVIAVLLVSAVFRPQLFKQWAEATLEVADGVAETLREWSQIGMPAPSPTDTSPKLANSAPKAPVAAPLVREPEVVSEPYGEALSTYNDIILSIKQEKQN